VLKREIERAIGRVLEAPSFRQATTAAVATILDDAQVERGVIDFMSLAMTSAPTKEALESSLGAMLDAPVVTTTLSKWLNEILADPTLGAIGDDLMKALVAAPELRATFASLVTP
jgi:hypothetical protein